MNKFDYLYPTYNNVAADTVTIYEYDADDLKFFIAVDSLKQGPAVGACRFINNTPRETALTELCKMARTMTEKNLIAGLPYGGGKAFIYYSATSREDMLTRFAMALNELKGIYYTTNDIGTSIDDMEFIRKYSPYAKGTKHEGQIVPATAYGVFQALKVAAKHIWGTDNLQGKTVALQGVGNVGLPMLDFLLRSGCRVIVDDIDKQKLSELKRTYKFDIANKDFATCDVDIIVPCAIGGVINADNVNFVRAKLIVGGANNQLASDELDKVLYGNGVLFIPDMLANYGGMIDLYCEGENYCESYVFKHINPIREKVRDFIIQSKMTGKTVLECLNSWVRNSMLDWYND